MYKQIFLPSTYILVSATKIYLKKRESLLQEMSCGTRSISSGGGNL